MSERDAKRAKDLLADDARKRKYSITIFPNAPYSPELDWEVCVSGKPLGELLKAPRDLPLPELIYILTSEDKIVTETKASYPILSSAKYIRRQYLNSSDKLSEALEIQAEFLAEAGNPKKGRVLHYQVIEGSAVVQHANGWEKK